MIKKVLRAFNCLIINNIKFIIIKFFHLRHFKFNLISFISPEIQIDIRNKGMIIFGKKCSILKGNLFGVRENGIITISDGSFFNRNCQVVSHKKIFIGKNVYVGPNTVIMDHDHIFSIKGVEKKKFNSKAIIIEDNVWIGANVIILKGVTIGKNSVIAAGTVVTKDVPPNSILIQRRDNYIKELENN